GLDLPEKLTGKPAGGRRDLLRKAAAPVAKVRSHDWTPKQKKIAAIGLAAFAGCALIAGAVIMIRMRPPALPLTFAEGVAVMKSSKFQNLDSDRQAQYEAEMARLMKGMDEEARRAFFRDPANRGVMDQIREQQFDEMAKQVARGQTPEFPQFGPGP